MSTARNRPGPRTTGADPTAPTANPVPGGTDAGSVRADPADGSWGSRPAGCLPAPFGDGRSGDRRTRFADLIDTTPQAAPDDRCPDEGAHAEAAHEREEPVVVRPSPTRPPHPRPRWRNRRMPPGRGSRGTRGAGAGPATAISSTRPIPTHAPIEAAMSR